MKRNRKIQDLIIKLINIKDKKFKKYNVEKENPSQLNLT
jgi:hypothetical protein